MASRSGVDLGRVFLLASVLAVSLLVLLGFSFQRRIVFPLTDGETLQPSRGWVVQKVSPGLHGWRSEWVKGRRTALMFHGNAVRPGSMAFVADAWVRDGWNVFLVEYPGYDGNAGSPTERSMRAAASAAWDWAVTTGVDPSSVVLVANSMGVGMASSVAGTRAPAGFLAVSGVDDMANVVRSHVPLVPSFMVLDRFRTADAIRGFGGWTRVWHARDDVVVPFSEAESIARAAGTAVTIRKGGHALFWEADLQSELRREADRIVPAR